MEKRNYVAIFVEISLANDMDIITMSLTDPSRKDFYDESEWEE